MARAIGVLVALALAVGVAMGLASLGGSVEIRVGDVFVGLSFPVLLLILALLFVLLHGLLSCWGALRRWPERLRWRREARSRREGDAALTRALVALAAGTPDQARLEVRRARSYLGDQPQLLLLAAEAERLGGREAAAEQEFKALAAKPESRFLGLRGLLRQAMARQDWDTALRLAKEAEEAQPGAAWVREERAQLAIRTRDWREALALAPPDAPKAALALAAAMQEPEPGRAAELERQAYAADHGFTPAALAHARRLRDAGSPRRARQVLEEAWLASPHPDLAEPYLEDEAEPLQRVRPVGDLVRRNPEHAESRLLVARTALAAGLTGRARGELEALLASGAADRRAYVLLAEVEEAEQGETPAGRAAQARWLREAARAAPEPHWRCTRCAAPQPGWAPVCTQCGTAGSIAWGNSPAPRLMAEEIVNQAL